MEHWESSIKKEQERIHIKFKLLNKFKYIFVNFLDGCYVYNQGPHPGDPEYPPKKIIFWRKLRVPRAPNIRLVVIFKIL